MKHRDELKQLEKLVGTWEVTGDTIKGTEEVSWMEGNYFLVKKVNLIQDGEHVIGTEIIGFEKQFFQETESPYITSRFYDNNGNTLDYTYEVDNEFQVIWGGDKGSPAYYKGKWNDDFTECSGDWVYPGGGGYSSTARKIK